MVLAFLLVAAPWYVWVGVETKGAWLVGFWNNHHVKRVMTPMESHGGPFFYYVLALLAGLAPWSIFLGPTVLHTWRRLRESTPAGDSEQAAVRFLTVWFVVYFLFFSVVKTKLPNYILPAYPAAALLTAHLLTRWRRGEVVLPAWVVRLALACLVLLGAGVTVGLLFAAGLMGGNVLPGLSFPGVAAWAWVGAIWIAAAAVAWYLFERGSRTGLIVAVACAAVLFAAPVAGLGVLAMESHKAARQLARALPEDQARREVRLAALDYFQPSLVFYCRREVQRFEDEGHALAFLHGQLPSFLFVPEEVWIGMQRHLAMPMRVLARHRDLYSGRMIVVVTNEAAAAAN
jgi:4-amino-4-deoxy-L-arabinose transferase-like glycosyltransferase